MNLEPQQIEVKRTFNLGDFESLTLSAKISLTFDGRIENYSGQVALIEQVLELFKCRLTAAEKTNNTDLVIFIQRNMKQLEIEKLELETLVGNLQTSFLSSTVPATSPSITTTSSEIVSSQQIYTVDGVTIYQKGNTVSNKPFTSDSSSEEIKDAIQFSAELDNSNLF